MIVELQPGDELAVRFEDTDGEIRIHFDSKTYPDTVTVEETAGLPDTTGREGILYQEKFGCGKSRIQDPRQCPKCGNTKVITLEEGMKCFRCGEF